MEQCLLLIAAWQIPQYKKIALDFTMDDKAIAVETLVKELEKQRLLTTHLNQAAPAPRPRQVDVRAAAGPTSGVKPCFNFQKGNAHVMIVPSPMTRKPRSQNPERRRKRQQKANLQRNLRRKMRETVTVVEAMPILLQNAPSTASATAARRKGINRAYAKRRRQTSPLE